MRTHPRTHTHANTEAVCRQEREEKNYLKNICFPQCAAKGNFCNKIYIIYRKSIYKFAQEIKK